MPTCDKCLNWNDIESMICIDPERYVDIGCYMYWITENGINPLHKLDNIEDIEHE